MQNLLEASMDKNTRKDKTGPCKEGSSEFNISEQDLK